jgi:ABC-type antimicrobial peptide transport system ATPase subunit
MLAGLWHKSEKNGEAKPRMIKLFVASIRPRSARIMIEERLLEHNSDDGD